MNRIELVFFEEYKRLDAALSDMYGDGRGVSSYIEDMERAPQPESSRIPGWRDDYYLLKHLRWMRNQLAHSASPDVDCTEGDLDRLRDFYQRVLSRQDPIAVARAARRAQARRAQERRAQERRASASASRPAPPPRGAAPGGCLRICLTIAVGAAALLACLFGWLLGG